MNNNVNFAFISGAGNPGEMLDGMMQLLEGAALLNDALRDAAPDFTDFGGALVELADTAEMYRDKLDSFIAEADRLLAALDDLDARRITMGCYTRGE